MRHLRESVTRLWRCLEWRFVFPSRISIAWKWFCIARPSSGHSSW